MGLRWTLHPKTTVFTRERRRFRNKHTATKEDNHKKKAKIAVRRSDAQEHQEPAEAERGKERFYPGTFGGNVALLPS